MASNVEQAISIDLGEDGVAASTPLQIDFPRQVAPSLEEDTTHNTIKEFLIVVGCSSVPDAHFEFDSSFILPEAKTSMRRLAKMRQQLSDPPAPPDPQNPEAPPAPGKPPPLSLFGHADPVGQDAYNSTLSQRRASAIYALLIRDVAAWERLMNQPFGGDRWGKDQFQIMQDTTGAEPKPFLTSTERKALIKAYMDAICVRDNPDGSQEPYTLDKNKDFLAGGTDNNAKGDAQGCGEFNPTLILSKAHLKFFEDAKNESGRNAANEINRRVIAFLFKPGSQVDAKKWPCPHVRDANAVNVCPGRFWKNGSERRAPEAEADKKFGTGVSSPEKNDGFQMKNANTFACRFYHGIAGNSPCEGVHKQWVLRLLLSPPVEGQPLKPFANRRFVVTVGDAENAPKIRGKTDSDGILRLPVFDEKTTMKLKLDVGDILLPKGVSRSPEENDQAKTAEDEKGFSSFTLKAGELLIMEPGEGPATDSMKQAARQRLFNLGYGLAVLEEWDEEITTQATQAFQRNEKLPAKDGTLDSITRKKLVEVHDTLPKTEEA